MYIKIELFLQLYFLFKSGGQMRTILIIVFICCVFLMGCHGMGEGRDNSESHSLSQEQKKKEDQLERELKEEQMMMNQQAGESEQIELDIIPQYKISSTWFIEPINANVNEKVVLLTIDDAPDEYALHMAKTLYELNANAIFFVNGHLLESEEKKQILKKIYEMGFMIGNHTYSHTNLSELTKKEQLEEIVRVNDMVEEITGERPSFFRAPFGINTDYSKQVVSHEGMVLMNWTYGYDWENGYMSKESLTEIMLNTNLLRSGANLLMHDREWTSLALHDIVLGFRAKGYDIVNPKHIQIMK